MTNLCKGHVLSRLLPAVLVAPVPRWGPAAPRGGEPSAAPLVLSSRLLKITESETLASTHPISSHLISGTTIPAILFSLSMLLKAGRSVFRISS
jgi:hypothetical protein